MISQSAALLHRALRVDVRLVRSHFFRAALLGFVVFWLADAQGGFVAGAPGLKFFGQIHLCNLWFITFAGVTFFATAITEEKEEQTLGLLKMAGISALALLAGKWAPRVVGGVLLLTVQLPFTLLAITLGGVLWDQVLAAYCTLLAHLVLVGCVGLFSSVVARRSTGACTIAALILGGLFVLPRMLNGIALAVPRPGAVVRPLASISGEVVRASAWTRLGEIQATNFNGPPVGFQVASNLAGGAAFFLLAWSLFNVCTRSEAVASVAAEGWSRLWRRPESRRAWDSALTWKEFHFSAGGPRVQVVKLVGYGLLLIASFLLTGVRFPTRGLLRELGESVMGVTVLMFLLECAVIGARCYRAEVQQQTWGSLCMLPRSVSEIAYRKLAGQALGLLPVVGWFWFGALLAPGTLIEVLEEVLGDAELFLAFVYMISQFVWLAHLIVLLSITIDWAAWPVSIFFGGFTVFLWNVMFTACLDANQFGPDSGFLLFMICIFGCGQVAITHWLIGERLRILAGR